jgi:predicted GNAT family N-acyltransferase
MDVQIKAPAECTPIELDAFEKLVVEGGEVTTHGLRQRIEQAKKLVFINEGKCVAVCAIKNPNEGYKSRVFEKAGVAEKGKEYTYELGWLYVTPAARGNGLGHKLMEAVTDSLGTASCYATTRENNASMHHLLPQYYFQKIGSAYQSNNGYFLVLYANRP